MEHFCKRCADLLYLGHCMLPNIWIRWWNSKFWDSLVERGTTKKCEGKNACFNSASKDISIQGY